MSSNDTTSNSSTTRVQRSTRIIDRAELLSLGSLVVILVLTNVFFFVVALPHAGLS